MKNSIPLIMLALFFVACKPKITVDPLFDPVYDCTALTNSQIEEVSALIYDDECDNWECQQGVMQLYCSKAPSKVSH